MNVKIPIHQRNFKARLKTLSEWKIDKEDKKDLIKFLNDLELGKVNKGKRIGEARRLKYLTILKIPLEFWNKPTSTLTEKDIESFEKSLTSKLKSKLKKKSFSANTKSDIKKALKIYLKWKGLNPKLYDWLDTSVPNITPDYLKEEEIRKLYKSCKNAEERFLIAVLFDSGARAEEFHNIRYEDIQLPKESENFIKLTLKEEYSKSKGRVISLYWENTLEAVRDYLKEREKEGIKNNESIFKNSYDNVRQILYRLGKRALKRNIHYHLFRHSSATHYASKLNRQQLCYRYGWAFSSRMPDVYISRAGMENKELDEKFEGTELGELKSKLSKEEFERKKLKEDIDTKEKEYYEMFSNLKKELKSLKREKQIMIK
jgi:integrase